MWEGSKEWVRVSRPAAAPAALGLADGTGALGHTAPGEWGDGAQPSSAYRLPTTSPSVLGWPVKGRDTWLLAGAGISSHRAQGIRRQGTQPVL